MLVTMSKDEMYNCDKTQIMIGMIVSAAIMGIFVASRNR